MARLLLAFLVGALAAAYLAWELRREVAFADQPAAQDQQHDLISAAVEGCANALGVARIEVQAGIVVATCRPNLGAGPEIKRRVRR